MEKREYYNRIDIIRIISCIMVLLYHLNILKGGYLAVCTFFTLSGYLVCMSALKREKFSIKEYYINTLKRIYIPLIIVVFITVIIAKLNPFLSWMNLKKETTSVIFGYNNFWQLSANLDYFTRNVNSPFTHLWYISILMQFDLIFPIIFLIFRKIDRKARNNISTLLVFLLMLATTILFFYMSKTQDIMQVYYNTIARSFSILWGVILALVHNENRIKFSEKTKKYNNFIYIIYTLILIALGIFVSDKSNNYAIYMILTTFITTRLIKYSLLDNRKQERVDKLVKSLAKITYEIYLVQYPVIFFMNNIPLDNSLKIVLIILITIIVSLLIHLIASKHSKTKVSKIIKNIIIIMIIIIGSFIVITEKDNTAEMKELENILNENAKIMEERNQNYINDSEKENNTIVVELDNNNTAKVAENKAELTEEDKEKIKEKVKNLPVVGIGDSVMLDAVNEFYKVFPKGYFDGKISRSLYAAKDIVKNLKSKGKLGNTLILCLATNGDYSNKINKDFMSLVGDREIYWVNAVGADDPQFNERFKKFAADYPNIHIVEWDVEAKKHPEYFYSDKVHMKPGKGMREYVYCIYQTICNVYIEKAQSENK